MPIIYNVTIEPNQTSIYYGTQVNFSTTIQTFNGVTSYRLKWYEDGLAITGLNYQSNLLIGNTTITTNTILPIKMDLNITKQKIGSNYTFQVWINDTFNPTQNYNSTIVFINSSIYNLSLYPSEVVNASNDINGSMQLLDESATGLFDIIFNWFVNSVLTVTDVVRNVVNGTYISSIFDSGNYSHYDNITLQIINNMTDETLNTTTLYIYNEPPNTPTIFLPPNNTNTVQGYMDINCSNSTDPDDDDVYYEFWNVTSISSSLLQNTTSSGYRWEGLGYGNYNWLCRASDGNKTSSNSTTWMFNIRNITMSVCNIGSANSTLNITLWDETNSTALNGTMNGDIVYYVSNDYYGVNGNKTLYYNVGLNHSFIFCMNPFLYNITANATFNYDSIGYPTRKTQTGFTLTNTTINNTKLYLLSSTDGIYTTFQVVNPAGQSLDGVLIIEQKYIGGILTLVEEKYTDASGGATFWVDYTLPYYYTFIKEGYTTYSTTITPTQSSYTITLSPISGGDVANYNSGISYIILPTNSSLNNNTDQTFAFQVNSSYWSLQEAGFFISNNSGNLFGFANCSSATSCTSSLINNTGNNKYMTMKYFWRINDTYINGTHTWYITETYVGNYSLVTIIKRDLTNLGSGFSDFTKGIICLIIILLVIGAVTYSSGTFSPVAITWLVFALMLLLESIGLAPIIVGAVPYFMSIILGLIAIGYTVWENRW